MRANEEVVDALKALGYTIEHKQEKNDVAYTHAIKDDIHLDITQFIQIKSVSFNDLLEVKL